MTLRIITLLLTALTMLGTTAQAAERESPNARQARQMFMQTWNRVFNEHGASLHYKVNVANVYKTEGTIWYKGKKSHYVSKNSLGWNDGTTAYITKEKKKIVEIYPAQSKKKGKYEDKFEFKPDNYTYSITNDKEGYLITVKAKKGVDGVKEARLILDRTTRDPKTIRIKVAFLWAKLQISNFKSGNVDDAIFAFPRSKYQDYKFIDKRE